MRWIPSGISKGLFTLFMLTAVLLSQNNKRTLAVMDFDGFGMSSYEAQTLTERLRTVAVEIGTYIIVERGAMDEILKEQGFQQSGCTSDECIVEVGELMGVEYMLGGTIGKVGNTFTISMRIINVESAEVEKTASYDMTGEIDKLLTEGMREAAYMIMGEGEAPAKEPAAKASSSAVVLVQTNPKGARISVNGENKGLSPTRLTDLKPGETYQLTAALAGYTPFNKSLTLKAGKNPPVVMNLTREQGFLTVSGKPSGAKLILGGKVIGTLPVERYSHPTGQYSLVVKKPGFKAGQYPVNLIHQQETTVSVSLEQKSKMLALLLSGVVPGTGQMYQGSTFKGLLFLVAGVGTGYLAYNEYTAFQNYENDYNSELTLYNQEKDPALFKSRKEAVNATFKQMQTAEKNINTYLMAFGGVWTLNLLEIVF